ncbi:pantoate--beta-alanine ligase [Segniliparus rugosus]|uniref:Pantothenate synthetase n=1 Tax=Segniliparus rugosus (strain ATCC BAA-974 / DSM 45345 / CCUG 50838 / CIP 108380 / JCM 13579 / CDC 945) TaxID=679197 RepID=E5XQY2_SEGRC|nr:pantoate--beta-alanine ligase [Segniliparus rugosus]EFV13222.1 pantoate-beta-alanine ligase [Segniliparus rugosus ATCC BAA-974]
MSLGHGDPVLCHSPAQLRELTDRLRAVGRHVALVPTMGALHQGHLTLVEHAKRLPHATVVASIFVNPLQFGQGEDFERYPRPLTADLEALRQKKVRVVYTPSAVSMYPPGGGGTQVIPGPLADQLEGAHRPGHFTGVLTVVLKLLAASGATWALFGEKDYQQLTLIRQMIRDLDLPVTALGVPTVREPDGLALSSRNVYLSAQERAQALGLSAALRAGAGAGPQGGAAALAEARRTLDGYPGLVVDYLELRDPDLGPAPESGEARLLVAARCGKTRLIDNMPVRLGDPAPADGGP